MEKLDNRFTIEAEAGKGGFGRVYRAFDERMYRRVAIKETDGIGDREAHILMKLDHKGLPAVYDICRQPDKTYIVMEWIEGMNLEEYIETHGAVSESRALKIGTELLGILKYLHSLSPALVFQDLKPANIMLMPSGHVKLIDFGAALMLDYGDREHRYAGTVGYGAPEQRGITGPRHAGVRSDIYAWGAVMYSLLTGRMLNKPPYTMEKIRVVCPQLSYGMCHIITRAVSRNESDRYANVSAVLEAIKSRGSRDLICKILYCAALIIFAIPLVILWFKMLSAGDFGKLESLRFDDAVMRHFGELMLSAAWFIGGLRLMLDKHFIRVERSVYLSDREFPGLWIGAMLAGCLLGGGMSANLKPLTTYAEETSSILPVSLLDEKGNRMLLKYDTPYGQDSDLRIMLDGDVYADGGYVTVTYESTDGEKSMSRRIEVCPKAD